MTVPALEIERCYRECERITRREAANFHYGIRLLGRDKRHAMSAVYAFARRVDDVGDGDLPHDAKLQALGVQRAMVARLDEDRRGAVADPVAAALAHARQRYALPLDALELLIEGVELDVRGAEYATFDELVGYCRRVAGTIGRLCVAIFRDGAADAPTFALADDLGVAMQLINIIRDVREDRELGRVYLPAEDLRRFGLRDLTASADRAAAAALVRFEAQRARGWYERGMRLLDALDGRSAACLLAMTGIYRTLLARIEADPAQVLDRRVSLAPWEKAWVATRSLAAAGAHA